MRLKSPAWIFFGNIVSDPRDIVGTQLLSGTRYRVSDHGTFPAAFSWNRIADAEGLENTVITCNTSYDREVFFQVSSCFVSSAYIKKPELT